MAIVTGVTVLGDINITIASPYALSVPMSTNGETILITTSGTQTVAGLTTGQQAAFLAGVTLTVTDLGHDQSGNQVTRTRTVLLREFLRGPWNENGYYQPTAGQFYVRLDQSLFNQDATWKSTVTQVAFAAGWLPSATSEFIGGLSSECCTRNDSLAYFVFPIKVPTVYFQRVGAPGTTPTEGYAGTFLLEVGGTHNFPLNAQPWACVEAWTLDSASTVGTTGRQGTMAVSPNTPGTQPGLPVPTYAVTVPVDSSLLDGRCEARFRVKPWIGPPVESATYGDAVPTLNCPIGVPFCKDFGDSTAYSGNHAFLHGMLFFDPANSTALTAAGKTVITSSTNVATVDVSGLSLTAAGAAASNKVYPDLPTLETAVRRVNNTSSNLTIADPVTGAASYSYKRPTNHVTLYGTNGSIAGGIALLAPVTGSVVGSDVGCYSGRGSVLSQTNYPPGYVGFVIRSVSGSKSGDVRWRGRLAAGTSTGGTSVSSTNKQISSRTLWRGITFDSTGAGVTAAADNAVIDGGSANGTPTTSRTESAAVFVFRIDCDVLEKPFAELSVSTNCSLLNGGWHGDIRVNQTAAQTSTSIGSYGSSFASRMWSLGSNHQVVATAGASIAIVCPCPDGRDVAGVERQRAGGGYAARANRPALLQCP